MTLLGTLLVSAAERYAAAAEEAMRLAERVLAPQSPIPRSSVVSLLRRALRNGAWKLLEQEARALLLAASRAPVRIYRSEAVLAQLRRLWVMVELATMRGKAVIAALIHLVARGARVLDALRRGLGRLLALGIQLLNSPLLGDLVVAS